MGSGSSSALKSLTETGRHAVIYGISSALSSAIGIILIPVYTRYLSQADYGMLSLLTITMSFSFSVFSLGINSALFRFYYDDPDRSPVLAGTSVVIMTLSALAMFFGGVLVSAPLSVALSGNARYAVYFTLMFAAYALALPKGIPLLVMRAEKQSVRYSYYNIAQFILQIGLIIVLVAVYGYGIYGVVLGTLITNIIFTPLSFLAVRGKIRLALDTDLARKALRFGVPLVFLNISNLVLTYFDQYLLNIYSGLEDVAIYNLGYRIGMIIYILFIVPFYTAWGPMKYSVRKEPHAREFYSKVLDYYMMAGLLFVVAISAGAYDLLRIIATPQYYQAYMVVPIIVTSYLIYGLSWPIDLGVSFEKKTEYYAYITAAGALLNIGLNIAVIPRYGYMGAAATTLLAYAVMLMARYIANRRLYRVPYNWPIIGKAIAVASLLVIAGWYPIIENIYLSVLYRLLVVAAYPFLLYALGVVDREEIRTIIADARTILRRR